MGKKITDVGILFCSVTLATCLIYAGQETWKWPAACLLAGTAVLALADFIRQFLPGRKEERNGETDTAVRELILLDEDDKPLKSWDLSGKVSVLIGRENREDPVDVNLEECEYSALIDTRHAVLNYCRDAWYIEDLHSKNGIRIRKVDDGQCYKLAGDRPCRLMPGDIIYIAKTKLLIT